MCPIGLKLAHVNAIFSYFLELFRDGFNRISEWSTVKKLGFTLLCCVFLVATVIIDVPPLTVLRTWADDTGAWFVVVFIALYISITQFPIPRTLLTLSSGILFGPLVGFVIALLSTTASAILSLLIARRILGDWTRSRLTSANAVRVNHHIEQRGWFAVASLRMIAAVPFSLLNYVAGMTNIPLTSFGLATCIGSAPGTIVTVFIGNGLAQSYDATLFIPTICLAILGLCGLIIDSRLLVKSST
ncbi:TVP38/TMEM64 family inner membrane protein YdjZ [Corynebacterium diphtheriae subsp. lausannense]|nr:TVP38/TMEM64 family inner membrane protein YdjZ [Corynebacterium diphtheriae subsp. lausannense]